MGVGKRLVGLLLIALLGRAPAAAPPSYGWRELAPGLLYRTVGKAREEATWMHQVRLDPARYRLGLLVSKKGSLPLADLVAGTKALVAVNGGYFGRGGEPLGYQRDRSSVLVDSIATGGAFTGVFYVDKSGPHVVLREDFTPGSESLAIQCGPRLVADGGPVTGYAPNEPRRRTGVGVDQDGWIILFATAMAGNLTLEGTQKLLLSPPAKGGVRPRAVLNLDGGSSTQMVVRTKALSLNLLGYTGIPVGLAAYAR